MVENAGASMYSEDRVGFFRRDIYEQTGHKFRPLDVLGGRPTVLNSSIERARREHRESLDTRGDPRYYANHGRPKLKHSG